QFLHLKLLLHQVREGNARQQLVHPLLEGMPYRPDAAERPRATSLGIDRMRVAVDLEGLVLGRGHDVTDGNGGGFLRKEIPALGAADAFHKAGSTEAEENLFDVISGQAFDVGQFTSGDRPGPAPAPLGEVDRDDQAVFRPGSDPHETGIWGPGSRDSSFGASISFLRPSTEPLPRPSTDRTV